MDDAILLPPQNLDAERGVLGSMALMEEAAEYAVANLSESDFYSSAHTILFQCFKALLKQKSPCDPVTVGNKLQEMHKLQEIGGAEYIFEILNSVPHAAHVRYYADIVKKNSIRRRLIYLAVQAKDDCYDTSVELEPLISKLSGNLDDLIAERSNELQTVAAVVQKVRDEERHPQLPFSTGLEELDKMLGGGLYPLELSLLGARPSIGKTSLGWQIAEHIAKCGYASLFVSIEMSDVQVALRAMKRSSRSGEEMSKLPLYLEDRYRDLDEILNCIRLGKRRNMLKAVVIDYVQLIRTNDRLQKNEKIERCMTELKWIAKELRIAVIVLAQIGRKAEEREDGRPKLADLKGSGGLEESADVAMLLHRPEFYNPADKPGCAEIIVAKNRKGATGTVDVGYIKEQTRFVPYVNRPIDISGYDGKDAPF